MSSEPDQRLATHFPRSGVRRRQMRDGRVSGGCDRRRTDRAREMAIRSLFPTPYFGKRTVGETADDLSGARRHRISAPSGFRAVRGARGFSGVQVESRRMVPHTGCSVGDVNRIRRVGMSTHTARKLAPTKGRRGRLSDRFYRALSSSFDLPGAVFSYSTCRPWASGLGRQSRDLLAPLAAFGVNRTPVIIARLSADHLDFRNAVPVP
jgi:hypothetical protein